MEKINFKFPKFSLLPNKIENVVLNTFINASVKTFGLIISLKFITYLYWKRRLPYGKGIKFLMFREVLVLPFVIYWYKKLKVSAYEELDNSIGIPLLAEPQPAVDVTNSINKSLEENASTQDRIAVDTVITEATKTIKDKIHLSYVIE